MSDKPQTNRTIVVHTTGSLVEAMVIRGLLESAGIASPGSDSTDPFPLREVPKGSRGVEIIVLESRAAEARRIIAEYGAGKEGAELEEWDGDPGG